MSFVHIPTKKNGIDFILNPDNGKWVYTNNPSKFKSKILGKFKSKPLKGTQLVILNIGRECNLRCKYCFIGNKRDENSSMSFEIAQKALHRVSKMKDGVKKIVFHGSEPLLNFNLIENIINYGKNLDKGIKYSIQTNGTLLTPEIIDFFCNT